MQNKITTSLIAVFFSWFYGFSQNNSPIESILPMKDIDQTYEKINTQVSNLVFMTHVDLNASLVNYDDCQRKDRTQEGLKMQIDWYNTNDETGKMMADMVQADIANAMKNYKNSSGFEHMDQALESDLKGGKMWMYSHREACVNEMTGATGGMNYFTQIRAFVCTGNKIIKIDLKAATNVTTLEQSLKFILDKCDLFDFSSLK